MKPISVLKILVTGAIVVIMVGLIFFPPTFTYVNATNTRYPNYTSDSIVIAPTGYVISNMSGPGNESTMICFTLSHEAVVTGKWKSNNDTAVSILSYTMNKSVWRSELSSIRDNKTLYMTSGIFNNISLTPGKYYLVIGPNANSHIIVVATQTIIVNYT